MNGATAARYLRPLRAVVVPSWLAEVVRPRRAPVPWPEMARAALAICVPLSAAVASGRAGHRRGDPRARLARGGGPGRGGGGVRAAQRARRHRLGHRAAAAGV